MISKIKAKQQHIEKGHFQEIFKKSTSHVFSAEKTQSLRCFQKTKEKLL